MKVAILANPDSTHTRKWVAALCKSGIDIVLVGLHSFDKSNYAGLPNLKSYSMNFDSSLSYFDRKFSKLRYLTVIGKIKKILKDEKPDILHAHYASSFGLLGALCKFHPFIISAWGSDIFEFPHSSFIAKRILKYNLAKADYVMATSNALAVETKKYCTKDCIVTPFGVDTDAFSVKKNKTLFKDDDIIIGAIKTFEKVYGLEYLIEAFALVVDKFPEIPLKLVLVGKGSCENEYRNLSKKNEIENKIIFTGYVNHAEIADYYNNLDIFVIPSVRESFGVSVLEASACGLPVIATNTGGLPEVVINNVTGILVPVQDVNAIADALEKLIVDKSMRESFGNSGRQFVVEQYSWNNCLEKMINSYHRILHN